MNSKYLAYLPLITPVLTAGIIIVIVVILYKKFIATSEKEVIDPDDIKPDQLTHPKSQYLVFADAIQAACQGFGTNEAAIFEIFRQMYTDSDVLELIRAWGTRTYGDLSGIAYNATLSEVLTYEFNSNEIAQLNAILEEKRITIRF